MAAVFTTSEISASFEDMEFFSTFGGNPVSCAIGLSVLDVIEEDKLMKNAKEVGNIFINGLLDLMDKHTLIGDVRGRGLFIGFELVKDRETLEPATLEAKEIVKEMQDRNVLLSIDGPYKNVIKIKPPMVVTKQDALETIKLLDEVMLKISTNN
jgi:4-aminobutyrate aminotransferase-like enzyme